MPAERVIDLNAERLKRKPGSEMSEEESRAWLDGLMRSHGDRLARYFRPRVDSDDTARDLVIETFYQAWKSRHTYRAEAKASTWLWTIGRRTLASHYDKKSRRAPEVLMETLPEHGHSSPDDEVGARQRALIECLGKLSEQIQRTAELVWLLGHSYVEAGEILGDKPDSVRMRLKRARSPLQDCLANKGIVSATA